jgi:hypothetical protein
VELQFRTIRNSSRSEWRKRLPLPPQQILVSLRQFPTPIQQDRLVELRLPPRGRAAKLRYPADSLTAA